MRHFLFFFNFFLWHLSFPTYRCQGACSCVSFFFFCVERVCVSILLWCQEVGQSRGKHIERRCVNSSCRTLPSLEGKFLSLRGGSSRNNALPHDRKRQYTTLNSKGGRCSCWYNKMHRANDRFLVLIEISRLNSARDPFSSGWNRQPRGKHFWRAETFKVPLDTFWMYFKSTCLAPIGSSMLPETQVTLKRNPPESSSAFLLSSVRPAETNCFAIYCHLLSTENDFTEQTSEQWHCDVNFQLTGSDKMAASLGG